MRLLISIGLLILAQQGFAQGGENSAISERPRRFIFLVHGLNGTEKTFGDLPEVLTEHGARIQPAYDLKVIPIRYTTGDDSWTTYDFARHMGQQMLEAVGTVRDTDSITLVAHSQGGVISWIWYLNSLTKEAHLKDYFPLALRTEGLFTLGSPMWGSKLATLAKDYPFLRKQLSLANVFMGAEEVKEMAYGSDTIYRFRDKSIQLDQLGFRLPLRILAVAGVLPRHSDPSVSWGYRAALRMAEKFFGSGVGQIAETDMAVSIPSARPGFIYLKPQEAGSVDIKTSDFTHFSETQLRNLFIVQAPHLSFAQEDFYDMAEVPLVCRDLQKPCTHPTYGLILAFTMSCTDKILQCNQEEYIRHVTSLLGTKDWAYKKARKEIFAENMHSFILDFVMDLPEDYQWDENLKLEQVLKFNVDRGPVNLYTFPKGQAQFVKKTASLYESGDKEVSYRFEIDRPLEIGSSEFNWVRFRKEPPHSPLIKQLRITMHGHVFSTHKDAKKYHRQAKEGFSLPVEVHMPGFSKRKVQILVKPTYTSYINLDFQQEK